MVKVPSLDTEHDIGDAANRIFPRLNRMWEEYMNECTLHNHESSNQLATQTASEIETTWWR